ncbi:peptidase M16 [Lutibacter profundi]|uniref:Peptidase M16 n=1 Tax=Lutibacter profundi TaxID=1622118 RepID=A0A120IEN5_9FLAO|nr:pitrilysin family protein [Lutibacter profundi]AMC12221.1 peptidase M16 [Lutibacter profundi]
MKTKILSIITLFLLTFSMSAQIDRSIQPKPGPSPKINIGQPKTFELKNGLKVLVVENHVLPRVSATLTIDNNLIFEGDKAGVSSLTGSLMGSGTKNIRKDDFNEEVDYLGANISFSSQGAYMRSLSKYFPRVLELMADAAQNPVFTQEEFDKEVNLLLDGIKSGEKSVANIANRVQSALAYGKNHPYGEFTSKKTVQNIKLADVQNFYTTYFKPNNAYLVIVGDVNFKEVKKLIKKHFNNWEKGELPSYTIPTVKNVAKTEIDFINMPNAVQSNIAVLNTANLKMSNPDFFAVKLANKILGGGGEGRLFLNLREDKGYTYGAYSNIRSNEKTATVFKASAQVRNMVTDSSAVEFIKEIKKFRDSLVSEEELKNAKAAYIGSFVRNVEKPETVASYALNIKINNLPEDFYELYLTKINAVTVEDIQRVAQKYFSADNARIIIVGKALDVLPNLEKLPYPIKYFDKEANPTSKPEMTKPIPAGVTKQTVIDSYFEAIGGQEKVNTIKTVFNTSEASMQGMTLLLESKSMVPNKQSVIMSGMGMIMSKMKFDGEKGYSEQQGRRMDLAGKELEKVKSNTVPFPETGYAIDEKVSLEKIEPIDGNDTYVLKVGDDISIYYDVASGLKIKQATKIKIGEKTMYQTFDFSDYKDVDGIKFPHLIKMTMGPQQFEFIVKEILINKDVANSDFE